MILHVSSNILILQHYAYGLTSEKMTYNPLTVDVVHIRFLILY